MAIAPPRTKPLIDARRAVDAAHDYFKRLFPGKVDVRLEEVELTDDRKHWLVTLGHFEPPPPQPALSKVDFLRVPVQKLKVFKVDAHSGEVLSMKIRE